MRNLVQIFAALTLTAGTIACSVSPSSSKLNSESNFVTENEWSLRTDQLISVQGNKTFLSGINTPWHNFGRDFGSPLPDKVGGFKPESFASAFNDVATAGGNTVRIWVHTSGEFNPSHDANGFYSCNDRLFLNDLISGLRQAEEHNLNVILVLWSFDMLDNKKAPNAYGDNITIRNRKLLTDNRYFAHYAEHCLVPLVHEVRNSRNLVALEIFNEPEGMTTLTNWSNTLKVTMPDIQKFVGRASAIIHHEAPNMKVAVGSLGLDYLSYYSDEALFAASGETTGTLDFYQAHYYGWGTNPFTTPAIKVAKDKPILIGEFASNKTNLTQQFKNLYQLGYAGALTWKYEKTAGDDNGSWADGLAAPALSCLADQYAATIIPADRLRRDLYYRERLKAICQGEEFVESSGSDLTEVK